MELKYQDEQGPMRQQKIEEFRAKLIKRDLRNLTEDRILIASGFCIIAMLYFLGFFNDLNATIIFLAFFVLLGFIVWPRWMRQSIKEDAELTYDRMSLREMEQFLRKENRFVRVLVIGVAIGVVCYFIFSTPLAKIAPPLFFITGSGLQTLWRKYRDNRLADEASQLAGQVK